MQEKEPFLIDVKYQQFLTIITLYHYNKHCFQTLVQLSINLRNFSFSFFLSFNACWTLTFNMKILSLALSYIWIFQSCRGALSYVFIIALSDVFPLFNLCYSISLKMNGGRYYNDFLDEFSFNLKVKACCCLLLPVFDLFKSTDCESTLSSTFDLSFVVNTSAKRLSSKGSRGDPSFKVENWFSVFPMNSFSMQWVHWYQLKRIWFYADRQFHRCFFPYFIFTFPTKPHFHAKCRTAHQTQESCIRINFVAGHAKWQLWEF